MLLAGHYRKPYITSDQLSYPLFGMPVDGEEYSQNHAAFSFCSKESAFIYIRYVRLYGPCKHTRTYIRSSSLSLGSRTRLISYRSPDFSTTSRPEQM